MSFDLKLSLQLSTQNVSPQQKKLNLLIDEIEQLKIQLHMWQNTQAEIQQQARKSLTPIYIELYNVLFQQLEQLSDHFHQDLLHQAYRIKLDEKIQSLIVILKNAQFLSEQQKLKVNKMAEFYQQHSEHLQSKKKKAKLNNHLENSNTQYADNDLDGYEYEQRQDQHEIEREQHRLNRQKQKLAQAQKMAEQSLKSIYLKIASTIHPDREQDENKKIEKTEMLQKANEAYEQQDLFYLLKLQIHVEQNKSANQKGLSNEQMKFYKLALDTQKQQLDAQIDEIIESLNWMQTQQKKSKIKKASDTIQIADMYKKIEANCAELKQQVKWEKERLKYMSKLKGLEMLLENEIL